MAQSATPSCTAALPTRKRATDSIGFCVADRPMRSGGTSHSCCRRCSDSARWLPRLFAASAWISSTITVRTWRSVSRPDTEPSSTYSDSGVVTSTCGGRRRACARSRCGVSPVRTAVRMDTSGKPSAASSARMPCSGASRLSWMSFESAFSGDTYNTWVRSCRPPSRRPSRTSASSAAKNAVRVLPEPVGAATSVCRPAWIAGHAAACAGVGAAKRCSNQRATAGWKRACANDMRSPGVSVATNLGRADDAACADCPAGCLAPFSRQ
ncbi:hypothetical protein NB713_002263 [Xanthomonas sacchari]|nr:hypothetical protein [Xanthomonas sacchari]